MKKKNSRKSRAGLLIGLGSIFLTLTVAGLVVSNQIDRQKNRNKTKVTADILYHLIG